MVKGSTNIDLVFRNGLKDFEVLPPPGVWDGISPAIAKKPMPFIWLRVAAVILVILSSAFLLYRYTREVTTLTNDRMLALSIPASPAFYKNSVPSEMTFFEPSGDKGSENSVLFVAGKEAESEAEAEAVGVDNIYIPDFSFIPVNNKLRISIKEPLTGMFSPLNLTPDAKSFVVVQPDLISLSDYGPVKPAARWSVAAMASPTYYSGFNAGSENPTSQLGASEQPIISYSGGVALSYKISRRFSVQSGIYYASLGQEVDGINSYAGFQSYVYSKGDHNFEVLTSSGTIFINNKDVFVSAGGGDKRVVTAYNIDVFDPKKASLDYLNNSLQQNFSYLELPVVLRYKLIDKAIDLNMTGGLSYNMLIGNSVYTVVDGNRYSFGETKGLNSFMVSSSVGMGMEYSFSDKLSINLEPTFRYYLNPFSAASSSAVHPYSFGIFSGLSYKF